MSRSTPPKAAPGQEKRKSPVAYSPELADLICERVANTADSLEKILKAPGMPDRKTFWRWREEHPELVKAFEDAKLLQVLRYADETIEIADERAFTKEQVMRNKLRISARQWYAEKLANKVFGQKVAHGGAEDMPPIRTETTLTPAESYKRVIEGKG